MTKQAHYQAYEAGHTDLCAAALISAWNTLKDYEDSLVLLGGLVPRFLCNTPPDEPQPATMDVDLGLAVGVRGTAYNRIADRLRDRGFKTEPEHLPPGTIPMAKFYKQLDKFRLCIEFLADRSAEDPSSIRTLDNMHVPTLPGIARALDLYRLVTVCGSQSGSNIRVCEVGPYLCLKLRAYGADTGSRHGKDIFDIVHSVLFYDHGPNAAIEGFAAEQDCNPAFPDAVEVLRDSFTSERGPEDYARFLLGGLMNGPAVALQYEQRKQSAALVGRRLLSAVS